MTSERAKLLAELLKEVREEKGFWPTEETFQLSTEVAAQFALELVLFGEKGGTVFLSQYEKPWKGEKGLWHLPGGWAKPLLDKNFEVMGSRIFSREIGVPIKLRGILADPYWWAHGEHDNPGSRPLSLYAVVEPMKPIVETGTCRFFPGNNPPRPFIGGSHQNFFDKFEVYREMAIKLGLLD